MGRCYPCQLADERWGLSPTFAKKGPWILCSWAAEALHLGVDVFLVRKLAILGSAAVGAGVAPSGIRFRGPSRTPFGKVIDRGASPILVAWECRFRREHYDRCRFAFPNNNYSCGIASESCDQRYRRAVLSILDLTIEIFMSLECNDVSLEIGKKQLLSHVSADVRSGSLTVLIGPNGAGKSTFVKGAGRRTGSKRW